MFRRNDGNHDGVVTAAVTHDPTHGYNNQIGYNGYVERKMGTPTEQNVHGRRVRAFSASNAKNTFGAVMDTALTDGIVAITKHEQVRAVVLSLEEYERMLSRQADPLRSLRGEFDALVASMQSPKARSATKALFKAGPEALGAAAVKGNRRGSAQGRRQVRFI